MMIPFPSPNGSSSYLLRYTISPTFFSLSSSLASVPGWFCSPLLFCFTSIFCNFGTNQRRIFNDWFLLVLYGSYNTTKHQNIETSPLFLNLYCMIPTYSILLCVG
ncbi:hypothetical protein NE237_018772 [Protea cynaroides]|uniref:Uncharacterized protein n=1 Tax=Protea cynaroides TaxID=273540 RepID=A0A9Q0KAG1_9MAGN|nr:hypothetical protein NE237_018772 [Protea cynaroides]